MSSVNSSAPLLAPLCMVAAMSSNRVIGRQGDLPWHQPEDFKHFKRTTLNHAIIMGRKTWESLGKALPKRRNIVVTRQADYVAPGAEIFTDLQAAIISARASDSEPMIIGGGELYRLALPYATRIELTEVLMHVPDGDATFPELPANQWQVQAEHPSGELIFRTFVRIG